MENLHKQYDGINIWETEAANNIERPLLSEMVEKERAARLAFNGLPFMVQKYGCKLFDIDQVDYRTALSRQDAK